MNPISDKNPDHAEKYYREFIAQNSAGIFRIDFAEPIAVDAGIDAQVELFYRHGLLAEWNNSFSNDFKLFGTGDLTDLKLSERTTGIEILNALSIRNFFQNNCRLDDFETRQNDRNEQPIFFSNSLVGVIKNEKLVCVWGIGHKRTPPQSTLQPTVDYEKYWQQTQKIEALGRLAGGIAHDFNNFLAVMMLQNDMLNLQLPANSALRHRIDEMKKAIENAAAMVKRLLAVGRKQTLHPKPTELNQTISEFSKILSTIISPNIEVIINLETDLGVCFIDQNQLVQVLINLTTNAKEAMPEGGILTIETANVDIDKNSVQHKSQSEGSFVQITVSDNGVGMGSTTLESVFEPFFSTKKSAKGVGLGLATAYGFVKQSKGFIWVESQLHHGTTFKIQFPRIDQPVSAA